MHRDESCLILRHIHIKLRIDHRQRFLRDCELLRIEPARLPEHHVTDRNVLPDPHDRHMDMIGQGDIAAFIEPGSQFLLSHIDDGIARIKIIERQPGQEFLELLQHLMVTQTIHLVQLLFGHIIAVVLAKGDAASHSYDFPPLGIIGHDYVVIQYFFNLHDNFPQNPQCIKKSKTTQQPPLLCLFCLHHCIHKIPSKNSDCFFEGLANSMSPSKRRRTGPRLCLCLKKYEILLN